MPRPRLRKTAKWAGVVLCAVMVAAVAVNLRLGLFAAHYAKKDAHGVVRRLDVSRGAITYELHMLIWPPRATGFHFDSQMVNYYAPLWKPLWRSDSSYYAIRIPLWIPFLLCAIPTALLWRRDHILTVGGKRARAGRCPKCGYDRGGLTPDTPCPECGAGQIGG
jgi:hypothetical protein